MDVHPPKNGINRYWSIPIWYFVGFLWVQGCRLRGSQLPSPTISSTFLQGTMDLRHALITYPQRHLTNSACCLRTFNNFYLPPSPPSVEYGGNGGVNGGWGSYPSVRGALENYITTPEASDSDCTLLLLAELLLILSHAECAWEIWIKCTCQHAWLHCVDT